MDDVELRIASSRQDAVAVLAELDRFARQHGASAALIHDLEVALDEVLGNVIVHGYRDAQGEICVRLRRTADAFVIEIEDRGVAFDPTQVPPPDLSASLRERQVGGLGLHFVKNLMDEVAYTRLDGRNRLRLVKHVPVTSGE